MKRIKNIFRFFVSMRFAIILLVILAAACSIGSLVTQGQTYEWYAAAYSERRAALIIALHLDDAFHSWWFILITAFLCLNLFACNVVKLPQLIRRYKAAGDGEKILAKTPAAQAANVERPEDIFTKLRMPAPKEGVTPEGRPYRYSVKNRVGLWGAWICHLGILMLILGFGLGQMTKEQYAVYGVPGQTKAIGDTGLYLTIDDFTIDLREDDTVKQYTAKITVGEIQDPDRAESAEISVNHPAKLFGMKFYQNSTGWAAAMHIDKEGEPLQDEVLCAGEYAQVADMPDLVIYLNAFYPDYVLTDGQPRTASGQLNNPAYLYSVYYLDQIIGMNALMEGEQITIDDYTVTFSDPQTYTVIQIKKDSFTWLAFVGGLVTMLGLILAFYLLPASVWAVRQEDGRWTLCAESRKGGALFYERFREAADIRESTDASN